MICPWALKDEFLKTYHDEEWCRPHHDDTYLFEMLVLEGAQAGLSWSTILKRREGYRKTFFHFDISRCAGMTDEEMEEIGYDDYFFGEGVCLIEWAELIEELIDLHEKKADKEKSEERRLSYETGEK